VHAQKPRKNSKADQAKADGYATSIRSALAWLDIPIDGNLGEDWLGLAGKDNEAGLHKRRHREHLGPPRPIDWDFWERFEGILDTVLDAFEKRYASVFDKLDQLSAKARPDEEDAKALRGALPQTPTSLGYFFGRLDTPAWIEPLDKVGFLSRPGSAREGQREWMGHPRPALCRADHLGCRTGRR
jgi:hypothetical protein